MVMRRELRLVYPESVEARPVAHRYEEQNGYAVFHWDVSVDEAEYGLELFGEGCVLWQVDALGLVRVVLVFLADAGGPVIEPLWFHKGAAHEYETLADRKFARDEAGEWPGVEDKLGRDEAGEWPGVEDPDSDNDDAQELAAGLDLTGFELTKDRGYYFIVDKESGERVLGPFRTEKQAAKRAMRSDTRSEFEAAQDVLSKLGR